MKWIGILLVFTGCAGLGWLVWRRMERRVSLLEGWLHLADWLEVEITRRGRTALQAVLLLAEGGEPLAGVMAPAALSARQGRSFAECWRETALSLERNPRFSALRKEDFLRIAGLREDMTRPEIGEIKASMEAWQGEMRLQVRDARERAAKNGKVARVSGIMTGTLLAILML